MTETGKRPFVRTPAIDHKMACVKSNGSFRQKLAKICSTGRIAAKGRKHFSRLENHQSCQFY